MRRLNIKRLILVVGVSGMVLYIAFQIVYPGVNLFHDPIGARLREISNGKLLWDARPFSRYRLVLQFDMDFHSCEQDIEIENEQVIASHGNTCTELIFGIDESLKKGATISNLFERVERDTRYIRSVNGIPCDYVQVLSRFDSTWGYPTWIDYRQVMFTPETVGGINYLRSRPFGQFSYVTCTLMGMGAQTITVKSLTPLS